MEIKSEVVSGVGVISPSGRIDSSTAPELQAALESAFEESTKLLLDFSDVPYISSAGLRVVLIGAKTAKSKSGDFKLCCLSESVQEVFELSGFASILKIDDSRDTAIQSISG